MQISIVMPTLNQAKFIDTSLRSIFGQSLTDFEVIVIDGLSSDSTIEILKKWEAKYPQHFKWISQKDSGPAEAINRGLQLAQGEIIGWLNSDDLYEKNTFKKVIDFFKANPTKHMVYGNAHHIDEKGDVINAYPTKKPDTPLESFLEGSFICQPTVFFHRSLLDQVGLLDTSFKLGFDFDWWIRFFKLIPNQIGFIDDVLASSRLHDDCLTKKERRLVAYEGMKILKRYFDVAPITWALTYIDELCDVYPKIDDERSLVKIVESFLTDIKPFASSSDLNMLIKKLQGDKRLILSNPFLYVDVSSDGWVTKKATIKLRRPHLISKAFMEVELRGGWLYDHTMSLTISNPLGEPFKTSIETRKSIKLKIKIPKTLGADYLEWFIETPDYFVPKEHDKNNGDDRKLSFMVGSVKFLD